ncbi:hypothetical protein CRG98_024667 [Punica granatum]|uniref:Uncharacterized protein n=1 Tax=Punica granatum TaxID=22663 RepID=A0A2I0JFC3_PUNGR|nr:hypothetical protein CRG98_024667 [Punica granatum]
MFKSGSRRILGDRLRNRPEEKLGWTGRWAWLGLGWACEKKRIVPRPISQRAAGIGGSGGDEAGGGGSRPWTPRRRPEWTREKANKLVNDNFAPLGADELKLGADSHLGGHGHTDSSSLSSTPPATLYRVFISDGLNEVDLIAEANRVNW